jgi:hypothetical protein
MAELKTKMNDASVEDFLNQVEPVSKREDSYRVLKMMEEISGVKPKMWGGSIIGFGQTHYKYASGREGDWFQIGFSPRKQNLTLYVMTGYAEYEELLAKLGKHKTGVSCLYLKHLDDVDEDVLREMLKRTVDYFIEKES